MPPKKLSKAEKERLKREEEEKKAREEEEARLREEQEKKEELKREREEAEERKRVEKEELSKRAVELAILRDVLGGIEAKLDQHHELRRKRAKWNRYMLCDKSPDPTIPQEINTFMNLWREDINRTKIEDFLVDGKLTLRLIRELFLVYKDMPAAERTDELATYIQETTSELQILLQQKLDRSTHDILVQATNLADPETANLQSVWDSDFVTLCLWGNLSKNPRVKTFEFVEQGISFEIPKPLTLTDCAFRCLFLTYDHLSHLSETKAKRTRVPPAPEEPEPEPEAQPAEVEGSQAGGEAEEADEVSKEPSALARKKKKNLMDELDKLSGVEEPEKVEEEKVEEEEIEEPEEDRAITPPIPEFDFYGGDSEIIDLRSMQMTGGIFFFDLFSLPPQPKKANNWTMTRILDPPVLQRLDYPEKQHLGAHASSADLSKSLEDSSKVIVSESSATDGDKKREKSDKGEERQPILFIRKIPPSLLFIDQPIVARWDPIGENWRTNGIEVVSYKEAERELSIRTSMFGPMALFQDAYMNFPFQSWELRPMGVNRCCLTIVAAVVEVDIEIKGDKCFIMRSEEEGKNVWAESLYDKAFVVPELVAELRHRGVSVFGRKDSLLYCDATKKNPLLEDRMHSQMALLSSAVAFSFSRWNRQVEDRESIVVQSVEHLSDDLVNEDDLRLYKCTRKKVVQLEMNEFNPEFDNTIAENTTFHADFYNTYLEKASIAGRARVSEVDYLHYETVKQLLDKTRPFIFA